MNRQAGLLGMTDTHYENPHGLPAKGHQSSARDLVKLAHAAMQNPLFRQYVSTRQHGTKVSGDGGYERDGRALVVVVLGSTSTDARYVDARNLFRWAWQQK